MRLIVIMSQQHPERGFFIAKAFRRVVDLIDHFIDLPVLRALAIAPFHNHFSEVFQEVSVMHAAGHGAAILP